MLTPEDFKIIEKQANKLYEGLELEIIEEIAERIANVGYANTVVLNDIEIAQEMGILYQDVVNLVAKYNNASVSQIQDIFETAGAKSIKFDDKIYKKAGLNPKGLSSSMMQLLESTAKKTSNNLSNLTMTTAATSQTQFLNAMNKAYLEVSTGVKSYSQSIIDTIKDISNQGAYVEYPSGQHRSIESAVRMNILTSVNQTSGKLQELRAEEMGWDLVEVSAHGGARPEHAEWQGKVYSLKGLTKGYKTLEEGCDYGSVTGLCGVNCRHTFFPYYKGSVKTYTNKELRDLKNETVTYNGKEISKYEASQMQRKMERKIRQNKKDIAGLQGILTSNSKDSKLIEETRLKLANTQTQLKQNNSILNDFVKQTGFKKDSSRLVTNLLQKNNVNTEQEDVIRKIAYKAYNNITDEKKPYLLTTLPNNKKIKQILQNNNKLASIVKDNINDIKIINIKCKGAAHYDRKINAIRFNLKKDKTNVKGEFATLFHEVGHRVDDILKRPSYNREFKNAIINDVNNFIINVSDFYGCSKEQAYKIIKNKLASSKDNTHSISDILMGATSGKIKGKYSHKEEYWNKNPYSLQSETFAHFFEATIRNDKQKIADLKDILPNAYEMFLKMF